MTFLAWVAGLEGVFLLAALWLVAWLLDRLDTSVRRPAPMPPTDHACAACAFVHTLRTQSRELEQAWAQLDQRARERQR